MPKFIDYTGEKIGRVLVTENIERGYQSRWSCLCDCGRKFDCLNRSFKRGDTFECKQCLLERKRGIDLTGRKYGRWTVICRELDKRNKTIWIVKCDCGVQGRVATNHLGKPGKSMSCGCLGRKNKSKFVNETLYPPIHKTSLTKLYAIRSRITHACYDPKNIAYERYGQLGYTVCDLWRNGARDFYNWCIQNGWCSNHVIGIHEEKKEFNPENCYVMPQREYRSLILKKKITYNGITKTCDEWAKVSKVKRSTILDRIQKGYSAEEAIFAEPHKFSGFKQTYPDQEIERLYSTGLSLADVGRTLGITPHTISKRLRLMGINPDISGRRIYRVRECSVCTKEYTPISSTQKTCGKDCKKKSRRKNPTS